MASEKFSFQSFFPDQLEPISGSLDLKTLVNMSLTCKLGEEFTQRERRKRLKTALYSENWLPLDPPRREKLRRMLTSLKYYIDDTPDSLKEVYYLLQGWLDKWYQAAISSSQKSDKYLNYCGLLGHVRSIFGILGYVTPDFAATILHGASEPYFRTGHLMGLYCIEGILKKNDTKLVDIFNSVYPRLISHTESDIFIYEKKLIKELINALQNQPLDKEDLNYLMYKTSIEEAKEQSNNLLEAYYLKPESNSLCIIC